MGKKKKIIKQENQTKQGLSVPGGLKHRAQAFLRAPAGTALTRQGSAPCPVLAPGGGCPGPGPCPNMPHPEGLPGFRHSPGPAALLQPLEQ